MAEIHSHWDGPNPGPDNTPFGEGRRFGIDVINWRGLDYEVSPLPKSEIDVGLLATCTCTCSSSSEISVMIDIM